MTEAVNPRLREKYAKEVIPALMKRFGYTNLMQVPRLDKIVINMGVGEATNDKKLVEKAATASSAAISRSSRRVSRTERGEAITIK